MLNSGTKYYADIEHCSRDTIEEWSKSNNWELTNEELDIPDYGRVCRLDAWRDKSPANIGELLGTKRRNSPSNGVDVIGGMISCVHISEEIAVIIWPILRNG